MAGRSLKSFGSANKDWSPGSPSTRYNASGKSREYYTFENAPGIGAYATGGSIVDGGDGYIYHIFTGPGTFQVNRPPAAVDSVEYLIVAGGGGSGPGGGGAGGMLFGNVGVSNGPGAYPVSVGAGGGTTPGLPPYAPANGSPSSIFGITAYGGGYGAGPPGPTSGGPGGSGGGGYTGSPGGSASGGAGNTPSTVPRQGYPGGSSGLTFTSGGGGGAGGPGLSPGNPQTNGPGKNIPQFPVPIVANGIPATTRSAYVTLVGPKGFSCGGGTAGISTANSGAGAPSGSGSSGIVCVRYKKTAAYSRATGGTIEPNTHPEHPGVWRHIFTSPGTFTVTDPSLQWIDYLAVGGGGGGGYGYGGGGGAGGFVSSIQTSSTTPTSIPEAYLWSPGASVQVGKQYPVSAASYSIGIGTGGNGGSGSNPSPGGDGSPTTIGSPGSAQIIAYGGGGGGSGPGSLPYIGNGRAGASGGGVGKAGPSAAPPYGTNGPAVPSPLIQGNDGFAFIYPGYGGAGGAGAGSGGAFNSYSTGGGSGWYSVLSPSAYGTPGPLTPAPTYRYFAGGGGGGAGVAPAPTTAGTGSAGGGNGGPGTPPTAATSATTNTGSGGGGGSLSGNGGNGAPGIVIIQYPE